MRIHACFSKLNKYINTRQECNKNLHIGEYANGDSSDQNPAHQNHICVGAGKFVSAYQILLKLKFALDIKNTVIQCVLLS